MRSRTVIEEAEPLLCKTVLYELAVFFAHYPPKEFNRNLRNRVVDYLTPQAERGMYDVRTTMGALSKFMNVLDKASNKFKPRSFSEIFALAKEGRYTLTEEENG